LGNGEFIMKKGTSHQNQSDRLAKIEGQVRGVLKMIDEERYCIDIITQLKSMQSALKAVEKEIIRDHIDTCVRRAMESGSAKEMQQHLREIASLLDISCK